MLLLCRCQVWVGGGSFVLVVVGRGKNVCEGSMVSWDMLRCCFGVEQAQETSIAAAYW
jgi:hypothetical protein